MDLKISRKLLDIQTKLKHTRYHLPNLNLNLIVNINKFNFNIIKSVIKIYLKNQIILDKSISLIKNHN